ncbi:hypothetical protein KI387_030900, partial [Taxus chinensis]
YIESNEFRTAPRLLRDCSATAPRLLRDCSTAVPRLFRDCSVAVPRLFRDYSVTILGLCHGRTKRTSNPNRVHGGGSAPGQENNASPWSWIDLAFPIVDGSANPSHIHSSSGGVPGKDEVHGELEQ